MRYRVRTPAQRYRAAEAKGAAERAAGAPDRTDEDARQPCTLDLRGAGGPVLVLEPRRGYHAWRQRDAASGELLDCAALKTLLHRIADKLPAALAPRTSARG